MRHFRLFWILCFCMQAVCHFANASQDNLFKGIRVWPSPDNTRVVLDFTAKPNYKFQYLKHPDRLVIDLEKTTGKLNFKKIYNKGPLINKLRKSASAKKADYRLVLDLKKASDASIFTLAPETPYGHRLVIDLPHDQAKSVAKQKPTKTNIVESHFRDIIIAIDAGHGGDDPGALGKYTHEKKITLEIAKRLLKKINRQKGMKGFLIRDGDYFVNLTKRTSIARKGKADFLVSIHADGFTSSKPRGASVWVLSNKRATSELGQWMEKHEAHSELLGGAGNIIADSDSAPFLTEMFLDMSMGNSMDVGYKVGNLIAKELRLVTKLHKKKPVHASLAVLKSPDIPSVLVEAGFITNIKEERLLNSYSHQNKIVRAIFNGIHSYFEKSPPKNTLFAQKKRAIKHTVRSGESLNVIALRYSISSYKLKSFNNLKSTSLKIGQILKIPANYHIASKKQNKNNKSDSIHKVKRGESLSVIAQNYGLTTNDLILHNKLKSTSLSVGQKLKLPNRETKKTRRIVVAKTKPKLTVKIHKVKSGESLSVIANSYDLTTNDLILHNKLKSTSLSVGQKLKIPNNGSNEVKTIVVAKARPKQRSKIIDVKIHKVQSGESLSVIANSYDLTTNDLILHNKLKSTSLSVGQKLKIPNSGSNKFKTIVVAKARPKVSIKIHKVKSGESLSVIANNYDLTSNDLILFNKLRSTSLAIGQKIKIPVENRTARLNKPIKKVEYKKPVKKQVKKVNPLTHTVRSGEWLSLIAQKYSIKMKDFVEYNNLASSDLRIGQVLKIPTGIKKHKVQKGGSLSVIARKYGVSTKIIKEYNHLKSNVLKIGQILLIPETN